jgi:indole-3-glycerol phosphate synthase
MGSADLLAAIVAGTRRIIEVREAREPMAALAKRAEAMSTRPGRFREALAARGRVRIIAECKRRSPSRGVLRARYDAAVIAESYARAGAAAISVLTEPTFFDGSLDDLKAVRASVDVPILRKDFVVARYQLMEARAAGADAVLLIAAALSRHELKTLVDEATLAGLDALVEVHDRDELSAAVDAGAAIIGVNNRNLRTLEVRLGVSEELASHVPRGVIAVSESGLKGPEDLTRLGRAGYSAFLIGERFMTEPDPGVALRALLDAVTRPVDEHSGATTGERREARGIDARDGHASEGRGRG